MIKHTPGPWFTQKRLSGAISVLASHDPQVSPAPIEVCGGVSLVNASIIAAAPDLLAALVECEACMMVLEHGGVRLLRKVQAAIAKAKGE